MFVPKLIWKKIIDISFKTMSSGARSAPLSDIKTWINSARMHTLMVMKTRLNNKLVRERVISNVEQRKLERLYNGWGQMDYHKAVTLRREAYNLIVEKANYFKNKAEEWKNKCWEWQCRVYRKTDSVYFKRFMNIKKEFIESTWSREGKEVRRQVNWLKGKGGVKINNLYRELKTGNRKEKSKIYSPTDEEIKNMFGLELKVQDPEMYGDVQVNDNEMKVLKLPPSFAVNEHVDIPELELELSRAAIKGRWSQRSAEQNDDLSQSQIKDNQVKDIISSNHWLKGGNEVDFTGVRPTSMKYNTSYILPGPIQNRNWEINWRSFELEALKIAREVNEKLKATSNDNRKFLNLEKDEESGLKSLLKKRKQGSILVIETDKSKRLAVDEIENYTKKMEPHTQGREIDRDLVNEIEAEFNPRAKTWIRILGYSEATKNGEDRARSNVSSTSGIPPCIYGLPKDHKKIQQGEEHPLRPVCSGDKGPDSKHSNILSQVIVPVNEEFSESQLESTEDLIAHLQQFNIKEIKELLDLYGTDVKALYPSLGVDKSADAVEELIGESSLNYKNIDFMELGRLMAYTVPWEKIVEKDLQMFIPRRKSSGGRKPKVTGRELDTRFTELDRSKSIWKLPEAEPTGEQVKEMMAVAVGEEVRFNLKNHTYRFRQRMMLQLEGGAIGSELTCVVSKTRIILFDRKLRKLLAVIEMRWFKLETHFRENYQGEVEQLEEWQQVENKSIRMVLGKWFVDDFSALSTRIEAGWRYKQDLSRMEWTQQAWNEDQHKKADCITASVMSTIMGSIDEDIKFTWDAPGNNRNEKMPVLDLQIWLERDEKGVNRVRFSYYEKPMASAVVINKRSALPWQTKKSSLAGEVARRILNCDDQAWIEDGREIINKFCGKLMLSGYNEHERQIILNEGESRVNNIKIKVAEGKRPLYRTSNYNKYERAIEKQLKKRTWFGNKETVLFVQSTPREQLRRQIQLEADKGGVSLRVVERGGRTLKSMLQKSEVEKLVCEDSECVICQNEDKGLCSKENIGYTVVCNTCKSEKKDLPVKQNKFIMHGESSRTAKVRCKEHNDALMRRRNSNLWDHCVLEHQGQIAEFDYKVHRSFNRDSLLRQIEEAKRLETEEGSLLNDKMEFVQPFAIQLKATRMMNR